MVSSDVRNATKMVSSDLLSTLAHEIRGPLSAMALSSELLLEGGESLSVPETRDLAQRIQRSVTWMQGIIENTLCDSQIRAGQLDLRTVPCDLTEIARDVLALLGPIASLQHHELELVIRGEPVLILGDYRRLSQALSNLITNACKYSHDGTPVRVVIEFRDSIARVSVMDRGPGLDVTSELLFRRHYRSDRARSSQVVGCGFGLSIVQAIVDAHGGSVGARNRTSGGAHFWFDLPVLNTTA
jgi:signal transduction histidine kinase